MIYLFEDRKGRMESYFKDHSNSKNITMAIIDCEKDQLFDFLNTVFSNSKAIIFHSSYSFNDKKITNEEIKKFFGMKRIPFVYFSGGLNNNLVIENGVINGNVNSGDMYTNLSYFLQDFETYNRINIPLLVYGRKYLINSLLELQNIITLYLFEENHLQILSNKDFNEIFDLVDARIKEDELKEDKSKLLSWLSFEKEKQTLNKQTLLDQLQKLINKY